MHPETVRKKMLEVEDKLNKLKIRLGEIEATKRYIQSMCHHKGKYIYYAAVGTQWRCPDCKHVFE